MTVRTTMTDIITRVKIMIDDSANIQFTDQHIQDVLDRKRSRYRYSRLQELETFAPNTGAVTWTEFTAEELTSLPWETDVSISDYTWNPLTATTSDYNSGFWTFATSHVPPLWISGKTYNIWLAAADLLEEWASTLKLKFDFAADDQKYTISQKRDHCLDQARRFRTQSPVTTGRLVRGDETTYG